MFTCDTILTVLASIGGLHRVLKLVFKLTGEQFNRKNIMAKYIRNLYYIEKKQDEHPNPNDEAICKDKFTGHL